MSPPSTNSKSYSAKDTARMVTQTASTNMSSRNQHSEQYTANSTSSASFTSSESEKSSNTSYTRSDLPLPVTQFASPSPTRAITDSTGSTGLAIGTDSTSAPKTAGSVSGFSRALTAANGASMVEEVDEFSAYLEKHFLEVSERSIKSEVSETTTTITKQVSSQLIGLPDGNDFFKPEFEALLKLIVTWKMDQLRRAVEELVQVKVKEVIQTQINKSRTSIYEEHVKVIKELQKKHERTVVSVRGAERTKAVRAMKEIIRQHEKSMEMFESSVQVRVKAVKMKEREIWSSVELNEYETELRESLPFKYKPDTVM